VTVCIGEPISWLRLESFALGAPDPAIATHVAACPACRQCLDHIRGDSVALPPLELPVAPRRIRRRWWIAPVLAAAAAVVVLVALWRPVPRGELASATIGVKGVGEVTLELVRERRGAIRYDARAPTVSRPIIRSRRRSSRAATGWSCRARSRSPATGRTGCARALRPSRERTPPPRA